MSICNHLVHYNNNKHKNIEDFINNFKIKVAQHYLMKLSFGKEFEDLFADVISSVRQRSLDKAYDPQQFEKSIRNSRYFIKQRPYKNNFSIANQTKEKSMHSIKKGCDRKDSFNKTFTTFKNVRYCLESNPQKRQQYHVRNMAFDNPARFQSSPKGAFRQSFFASKQHNNKQDHYQMKINQEIQAGKRYENALELSNQMPIRNSQRLEKLKVPPTKKLKLKHTEGIQGWNSNQLEQDITQFVFKHKKV